jgi:hypothetical protein
MGQKSSHMRKKSLSDSRSGLWVSTCQRFTHAPSQALTSGCGRPLNSRIPRNTIGM